MAPNNGLANSKPKKSGSTTILESGTVEGRGMGTNINSRQVISKQIQEFLEGEGKLSPKAEFRAFFTVWSFVTRLPSPTWVDHHPGYLMRGMAYFPLSGLLIGMFVSSFFDFAHVALALPLTISSVLAEVASIWVTGCFHEDGLADSADGIGGGWSRDEILKIMQDTRLGTYGCTILLLYMIAKVELIAVAGASVWALGACSGAGPSILVTQMMARLTAPILIRTRNYVDEQGPKYKFYSFMVEAKHLVSWHRVIFAATTSFVVAALTYGAEKGFILTTAVIIASGFAGRYGEYLLGGVMGDFLGATICVTEVFLLIVLTLIQKLNEGGDFFSYLIAQAYDVGVGKMALQDLMRNERNIALLQFVLVVLLTVVWCSNVGHPPVFVRESVVATKEDEEIRIALDSASSKKIPLSPLDEALTCPSKSFKRKYESARDYLDTLAKPKGSLGTLEDWAARISVLQQSSKPKIENASCLIFVGDHGVAKSKEEGGEQCSAYPQAVTQKVVEGLENGLAGASVLAKCNNVKLKVIDVGMNADFDDGEVVSVSPHKLHGGTKNFCLGPAMSKEEMNRCIEAGEESTKHCIEKEKPDVLIFGEVGIGNTTTSSTLLAALTGVAVQELCGYGATMTRDGEAEIISNKVAIVEKAMKFHQELGSFDPRFVDLALRSVGGAEIAAIVGALFEASHHSIPVLIDGFIVTTAALVATIMNPEVSRVLFFASKSTEKGQVAAFEKINELTREHGLPEHASAALDMNLRMGEATGALMCVPILKSAAAMINDLATLETVLKFERKSPSC